MSADDQAQPPQTGDEIHLPGPSLQPLLLAFSITVLLVGVTVGWPLVVFGGIMTLWVIIRWIRDTRREIGELPLHD